ncbi:MULTISPECIES: nitroreductase [Clostridia]|uniref:nitroreductase n=1 Tax=Clostridia TaxID=186801 RepID=UPI0024303D2B|nr:MULTISPECIES: nitroreductase [Clostridia]
MNYKKQVERDLKEYPYLLIAVDAGGLGYPTRYDIVKDVKHPSDVKESFVENCAISEEENKIKVDKITRALELLNRVEKDIIEECYFRNIYTNQEIIKNLFINKNKFYKIKSNAVRKIAISLGYL